MSFLAQVAREKEMEVDRLRAGALPDPHRAPPVRSLAAALSTSGIATIAEVKRGSPSEGTLRPDADAAAIARSYEAAGAKAISVLTDGPHFSGSLADLAQVRGAVSLPVLRKDFLIDPIQVLESRTAGADAVLLIVALLSDPLLHSLLAATRELGMEALIEVHTQEELERAVAADARILGVNSRDLSDLSIDLLRAEALLGQVPPGILRVAESGIKTPADRDRMAAAGADAMLVGSVLMTAPDPGAALEALLCG
jgi:indole-3-glycerol phosphate synthase